jgi:hypothetical protein
MESAEFPVDKKDLGIKKIQCACKTFSRHQQDQIL